MEFIVVRSTMRFCFMVFDLTQGQRWSRLLHGFEPARGSLRYAREVGEARRLLDRGGVDALLLGIDARGGVPVMEIASDLCRRYDVPTVVAADHLAQTTLIELHTGGVSDFVIGEPTPGEIEARLLISIDRRSTLNTLQHGYAAFRRLFDDAISPIVLAQASGMIVDANPAFLDLFGYTLREARELTVGAITHPDDAASLDLFEQVVRGERDSYRVRKRYVDGSGVGVWADVHATRVVEPRRGEVRVLANFQNLTPEIETSRALDRLRGRYRVLFEQMPSALLVIDHASGCFTEVNRAAEALFGYAREELMKLALADLWTDGRGTRAAVEQVLRSDRTVRRMRQQLRRKDGSPIATEVTITPLDALDTDVRLLMIHDISALQQLEQALEQAREGLAYEAAPFALAHDLSNMVTVVLGQCERLLEAVSGEAAVERQVEEVREAGERVLRLIRNFLSRGRAGAREPRPVELSDATAEAVELVEALVGGGIEIVLERTDEPLPIWFDPAELLQILLNLAANARDAMDGRGRLTLTTCRCKPGDAAAGTYARLSVSDTGSGIPAEFRERIFEPYFSTKPAGSGTGLGLAGVQRLVRRGGGHVEVESDTARGTTFHIDLPLDASLVATGAAAALRTERDGATILLVDDDDAVCSVVAGMLNAGGYRVLTATSSEQALEVAARYPGELDLLVVDATLLGLPAPELFARLHRDRPKLALVVMSGYLDGVLVARGILGHDTPFLSKPFGAEDLLAIVGSTLSSVEG